jgi:cyclopropane fatty-acyl-phospholipid synthase-like methyltransferase
MENQSRKESVIAPFIRQALDDITQQKDRIRTLRCLDLFCADGYYSCMLARMCPDVEITSVDLDEQEIVRARTAARLLGVHQATFELADVWEFVRAPRQFDLILCTGGLYHLTQPSDFVRLLRQMCGPVNGQQLVVQSVVTLENDDPDYFVSPAPGWKHGSRFTHGGLGRWLEQAGWRIVASDRNELSGNARPCDRGSSYYRCVAA